VGHTHTCISVDLQSLPRSINKVVINIQRLQNWVMFIVGPNLGAHIRAVPQAHVGLDKII
jgi:hypothetical protein